MSTIAKKIIQKFECPHCQKTYVSEQAATDCYDACEIKVAAEQERHRINKEAADSIRLHAKSIPEVRALLVRNSKKYFDVELEITDFPKTITQVKHASVAPMGKKATNDEWSAATPKSAAYQGAIMGKIKNYKEVKKKFKSIDDICKKFDGLNTQGWGLESFNCTMTLFIEDFPLISANFEEYQALYKQNTDYNSIVQQVYQQGLTVGEQHERSKFLKRKMRELQAVIQQIGVEHNSFRTKVQNEYVKMYTPEREYDLDKLMKLEQYYNSSISDWTVDLDK